MNMLEKHPSQKYDFHSIEYENKLFLGLLAAAGLLFVGLRALGWWNVVLLDDHDSVSYLRQMAALAISKTDPDLFSPDFTPFYPFLGSLLHRSGLALEQAARLTSLITSTIGFLAVVGIARFLFSTKVAIVTGFLMAITPEMSKLGFAVLTEPTYIALVYIGLFLYARYQNSAGAIHGLVLGIVFGLSFLTRTEGFMFLAVIPFLHLLVNGLKRTLLTKWKKHVLWTVCFVFGFSLLAVPQVISVSKKLGFPAINGRQVWVVILNAKDSGTYNQRIYGLDYDPQTINLRYIQKHPEIVSSLKEGGTKSNIIRNVIINVYLFLTEQLNQLFGPVIIGFISIGMYFMTRRRDHLAILSLFLITGFLLLVPSFLHNVVIRHIAVIIPLMLIIASIGIVEIVNKYSISSENQIYKPKTVVNGIIISMSIIFMANLYQLREVLITPPKQNNEYSPLDLKPVVDKITQQKQEGSVPRIMARKTFLAYMAGGQSVSLPFTDLEGLNKYARLNNVDFLFLQNNLNNDFPFMKAFEKPPNGLDLLFQGFSGGSEVALYRFNFAKMGDGYPKEDHLSGQY